MSIKENHLNGKIVPEKLESVIHLVEIEFLSMKKNLMHIEMHRFQLDQLKQETRKHLYTPDVLLDFYASEAHPLRLYQQIFDHNGKNFHEFFYRKRNQKSKMYEYFAHEFPIDFGRFKWLRVPEQLIKKARSSRTKNNKQLIERTAQNLKAFYTCLDQRTQRLIRKRKSSGHTPFF